MSVELDICNQALLRLGTNPITSFYEGTVEAYLVNNLIEPLKLAVLSSHPWSFATAQSDLSESSTPPIADYKKAFDLPSDFIRVISAGEKTKGAGLSYRILQNKLHCDADAVTLTYIYEAPSADWPPFFKQLLTHKLAAEICIAITESTTRTELMHDLADKEFQRAKLIDAQQDTPSSIDRFALVDVRG